MNALIQLLALGLFAVPRATPAAPPAAEPDPAILVLADASRDAAPGPAAERLLREPGLVLLSVGEPAWTAAEAKVFVLAPRERVPAAVVRAVRESRALALLGGTYTDWWWILTPDNRASRLNDALQRRREAGAPALAADGAAAFVARASVFEMPEGMKVADPRDRGETFAAGGLGWIDALVEPRIGGDLRPLLRAAVQGHQELALGIEGPLELALEGDELRLHGAGRLWLVDLDKARASRGRLVDASLALLHGGDVYDLRRGRLRGAEDLALNRERDEENETGASKSVPDALATEALLAALARPGGFTLSDPTLSIELRPGRAKAGRERPGAGPVSRVGVRFCVRSQQAAGPAVPPITGIVPR